MKEQVKYLQEKGIRATSVGNSEQTDDVLAEGTTAYSIVFGSLECLVGNEVFRNMFSYDKYRRNVVAVICDEVYTVVQW